jgi:hypothetical protein
MSESADDRNGTGRIRVPIPFVEAPTRPHRHPPKRKLHMTLGIPALSVGVLATMIGLGVKLGRVQTQADASTTDDERQDAAIAAQQASEAAQDMSIKQVLRVEVANQKNIANLCNANHLTVVTPEDDPR